VSRTRTQCSVTNNCGFSIWWSDLLDVSITITLDYKSSHIELLLNDVCLANLSLLSGSRSGLQSLEFSLWISESWTEVTTCGPNTDQSIVFCYSPLAWKRVTISGQRVDLYKCIRCRGNVFQLAVFQQQTFLLCFSDCTLPAFRRHVTIQILLWHRATVKPLFQIFFYINICYSVPKNSAKNTRNAT
jgi:hypothetical protein